MSYDNTNRGALFKNDNKETERHPDYKGNIDVNGVDYWIDAWIKKAESGRTYMSLSVKKKEAKKEEKKSRPPKAKDQDLDIPF